MLFVRIITFLSIFVNIKVGKFADSLSVFRQKKKKSGSITPPDDIKEIRRNFSIAADFFVLYFIS